VPKVLRTPLANSYWLIAKSKAKLLLTFSIVFGIKISMEIIPGISIAIALFLLIFALLNLTINILAFFFRAAIEAFKNC